jgi:hypothetical protein
MRVLFLVDTLGGTRHFRNVVLTLADRHAVTLATARQDARSKRGAYDRPGIEIVACPTVRSDRWRTVIEPLRRTRDCLRFFDPRYSEAVKIVERAAAQMPKGWRVAVAERPWIRRRWKLVQRVAAAVEAAVPCDPEFLRFVEAQTPDVVLVTPLVDFGSYQTEYVKCAHALGIPVLFLLYGWDNLTSKGLIRVIPDRVLVWNEHHRREAIEFQGVPAERVIATGAPRFDEFFHMKPSTTREAFCARLDFDTARPIILYVCSSGLMAPDEPAFVRRWIAALRQTASDCWLRGCQVLIRPHPAYANDWHGESIEDERVRVWHGRLKMNADHTLFDSLVHSRAVVGLNTSAIIEAAITERPIFTITPPEMAACQGGTLHFAYVLMENGGIVSASRDFDEHIQQLAGAPNDQPVVSARSREFLSSFVRPHGLDVPASIVMVEEIERAASMRKLPRTTPLWHHLVRWGLQAALRAGFDPGAPTGAPRPRRA